MSSVETATTLASSALENASHENPIHPGAGSEGSVVASQPDDAGSGPGSGPGAGSLAALEIGPRWIEVRYLRQTDVRDLEWHGGADWRGFYNEEWERHCRGEVCVLVADFNGFPIGHAAIHWHGKPSHPQLPDLQSFRVFAAFRSVGVGSLLLKAVEELVLQRGLPELGLAVGVDNAAARRLYERHGFHIVGEPYDDHWQYTNARNELVQVRETVYDMVKQLTQQLTQASG